jgi:cob(I)alamin adenosyltransferase
MFAIEHDLARSRMSELQAEAQAASRARRLYVARRAARRAERAVRRAASRPAEAGSPGYGPASVEVWSGGPAITR